jgi:hypothetical protein
MKEREFKLRSQKWDTLLRLGQYLIKYGALVICVWRLSVALEAFAGRQSLAEILIFLKTDFEANPAVSHAVMGILGLTGAGYGVRQRSLRQKDIKRLGNRVVELEKRLDPDRSSSRLTLDGRSRPEDEP